MRTWSTIFALIVWCAEMSSAQTPTTAPSATQANSLGIIVAPDTTLFTKPLLPDGTVDFVAAVNAAEGRGISPADNAVCVLIRLATLKANQPDDIQRRGEIEQLLGLPVKPNDEIFWQTWPGFQNQLPTDDPQSPDYVNRFDRAESQPWSSQDMPDLAAWLKTNQAAMALAAGAAQRSRFWFPIVLEPRDEGVLGAPVPDVRTWHELASSLCIRAMLKLHDRDAPGALDDLLVAQRLGNLLAQSPQLITRLVGVGCQQMACLASWQVLQDSPIPPEKLRQWSSRLLARPPVPTSPRLVLQRARYELLANVQMMAAGVPDGAAPADSRLPVLDWNRILRFGNSFFDDFTKDRSLLPPDQRAAEEKAFDERFKQIEQVADAADNTRVGNTPKWLLPQAGEDRNAYSDRAAASILMMMLPSTNRMSEIARRANEQFDWTAKVGVALAIYREDHGEYPSGLDKLIPNYLPRLPDNTSPNPVGYERHGPAYVIRNVHAYDARTTAFLAQEHLDYDWADIIIRTDKW
jgi:hypothetical protein